MLSEGEAYPQGLFLAGNSVYWANNQPAGCVRTTTKSGGAVSDTGCEPTGQTQPLQATLFNGKIVWAYMNTSQQPNNLGYGGVRSADVGGANAKEIESSARFVSTSGAAFCNDVFASSDNRLFWYSHLTPNGPFKEGAIRRYDGSKVVSFGDASAFPGGLAATPTTLFFGANNFLKKLAVNAAEGTKATDLLETNGRGCGTVVVGETLYTATLGGLTQDKPPTLYTGTASSVSAAGVLPEIAYYLASDGTDLYMAFDKKIARVPLSSPGSAPQTVLDSSVSIGGLAVDATHLYWTEYTASGAVRRKAK